MVRQFLIEAGTAETDFERRRRLQDQVLATLSRFSARALGCASVLSEDLADGRDYGGGVGMVV